MLRKDFRGILFAVVRAVIGFIAVEGHAGGKPCWQEGLIC